MIGLCGVLSFPVAAQVPTVNAVVDIAWSPNGSRIARVFANGRVEVTDITSSLTIFTFNSGLSPSWASVTWNPDSNRLAAGIERNVYVWNITSGQNLYTLPAGASSGIAYTEIGQETEAIVSIDWNSTGDRLASISLDGILRIWNTTTGQMTLDVSGLQQIGSIAWNPSGTELITGSGLALRTINPLNGQVQMISPNSFHGSGAITSVDLSPDGAKIANATVYGEVMIWDIPAAQQLYRFNDNRELIREVRWSPDGSRVASAGRDGALRIWNATTGQQLSVIQSGSPLFALAWSPDGTRVAYGGENSIVQLATLSNSGTGLRSSYFNNADLTAPVFTRLNSPIDFNYGTGSPVAVAMAADTFSMRWVGRVEPLYSETYTFYVTHNDGARLWVNGQQVVNNWTNQTAAVTDSGTIALTAGVRYDIVLEYYENTGSASVRLEWSSARQTRQVIPKPQLYPPEGQLAFTGSSGGNNEIYVVNPDGTGEINVSNSTGTDTGAAWSPDGTKLAFISTRDGNEELYLVNADGTGLRRLTNHTAADNEPAWSPDGTRIAFTSARTGAKDIYLINVAGTGIPTPTRLTNRTYPEYLPKWSPSGLLLVYVADTGASGGTDVFVISPTSTAGVGTNISNRAGTDTSPFFSPDGSKVAVRAPCGSGCSNDQIWVINTTSPFTKTRLTTQGGNYFQSWSPDGTRILFLSTRDGNAEVYVMNADGTAQTRLTNSTLNESYAVWSADARQAAFARSSDVWLMNADGSNTRNFSNTAARTEYQMVWWQPHQT